MNMITVTLQYGDNYVDVEFPCSDNYLQSRLNELHYLISIGVIPRKNDYERQENENEKDN